MDGDPSYPQLAFDITASNSDPDDHTTGNTGRDMRDKEYYFELVVFKVGNTTFRVPRNGLVVPGTIFEAMFSLPTKEENAEGSSDKNPINLPVNEEDFRGFLRAIYPFNIQLGNTDWLGALDLSTMWMFDEIRNRAIQALEDWKNNQSAKEVVLLAKKYRILKWLKDGYTRLLEQPSLTAAELSAAPSLDWETIAKLLSAKLLATYQPQYHYNGFSGVPGQNLLSAMEQEFKEEFSGVD